ncbi:hypothetical protein [Desertivibrio insolitus]|uniref:hypothetical protein n=1 Tax=Herbiconiux sp. SYSU D00978 TaxID=2812562 RepID=UPI001A95BE81|nr:hypothetical protein [Herbiconiux sp. SYSU D00978]
MSTAGRLITAGIALLVLATLFAAFDLAVLNVATVVGVARGFDGATLAMLLAEIVRVIAPPLGAALLAAGLVIKYSARRE